MDNNIAAIKDRNAYFADKPVDALVAFMGDHEQATYLRTDFKPMDAVIAGYGGKGFAGSSGRFFDAVKAAVEQGFVEKQEQSGPKISIIYRLTGDGYQRYDEINNALNAFIEGSDKSDAESRPLPVTALSM